MSSKYQRINIKPIKTGFLVEIEERYYDGDAYAFATWTEVLDFLKDKPVAFLPEEKTDATSVAVADIA